MSRLWKSRRFPWVAVALAFGAGLTAAAVIDPAPAGFAAGPDAAPAELPAAVSYADARVDDPELTLADGFANIVDDVAPAVVTIYVEAEALAVSQPPRNIPPQFREFFPDPDEEAPPRQGGGSGFIISDDGYILTNNHVVERAERITIELKDRRRFDDVRIVGRDPQTDVALLKLDATGLPTVPLGSSDEIRIGEFVLAIGSPGIGGSQLTSTVTAGIVSAKGRNLGIIRGRNQLAIEDFIQTDAAINPGNSGGPLLNSRGQVIGINSAITSPTGFNVGYGFAIPIELVQDVIDDLVEHGEVRRAVIGVGVRPVTATDAQFYELDRVAGVTVLNIGMTDGSPSPAGEAGIEIGDVILAIEGEEVESVGDLQRKIRAHSPGERVALDIVRRSDRSRDRVDVRLAAAASGGSEPTLVSTAQEDHDPLGLRVTALDRAQRAELPEGVTGVLVSDVDLRGALARAVGDGRALEGLVIQDVDGTRIESLEDYRDAVAALEPGDIASVILWNPGQGTNVVFSVQIPD